jgi:hypothetical protein
MEEEWVRVCSLTHNILGVKGRVGAPGWGLRRVTSGSIIHTDLHKLNKLVSEWLEHFWCMDEPRAYMDSQDSPWPRLGGSHHLHLKVFSVMNHGGLHSNVILSRDKIRTPSIVEGHNFLWRPPTEIKSKEKLYHLLKAFQRYVACHMHTHISRRFLIFSGRKSNWHFDS